MPALPPAWTALTARLAARGLNVVGVADGAPWQAHLPGCRAVLVVGSGGPALWEALVQAIRADPRTLVGQAHPLDAFVRRVVAEADPHPPGSRRWAFADLVEPEPIPIQRLALAAGMGWSSRIQLVLHPRHGPWMGLRAACFTTEALPVTGPLPGEGPCGAYPAPCLRACPGRAMADGRLDWRWCTVHRATTQDCTQTCAVRAACPEGAGAAYPALEQLYHHDKARGRAALAASLGLDDPDPPPPTDLAARARLAWKHLRSR